MQSESERKAEILRDHRELRALVARIEDSRDPRHLLALLESLRSVLERHFASEEAEGGLYDVIRSRGERYLPRCGALLSEHGSLLVEVRQLTERVRDYVERQPAPILDETVALMRRLRAHEENETHLLLDAMCWESRSAPRGALRPEEEGR